MPGRDMNTTSRDMRECIEHVACGFTDCKIPLEAVPIATLALAMFDDYRGNSPRDLVTATIEGEKELLKLRKRLRLKK